jgi:DNA-binding transcriptional MerR regulator
MISTDELLAETGIRAAKTLTRWHQRGLIPKPEIRTHPSGRGKMAYWPEWVVNRCQRIKRLLATGRSLEDIEKILGAFEPAFDNSKRRYTFRQVEEMAAFDNAVLEFLDVISGKLADFVSVFGAIHIQLWQRIDEQIGRRENLKRMLDLSRRGVEVYLLINGDGKVAVKGSRLRTRFYDFDEPTIVIPVSDNISAAFSDLTNGIPKVEPTKRRSSKPRLK